MKTDVLIIGGGLTGIAAAYEIIKNSSFQVDLLQWGGGASPFIHGFCLPIGKDDSEELFFSDSMTSGYGQSRESLVHRLCHDSTNLPTYFRELDLKVDKDENGYRLIKSLGSSAARIAGIGNNTGPVMLNTLRKRLKESPNYREHRNFRALSLVKQDGRVVGARCYDKDTNSFRTISAGLVILASGGFGRLFPESTNSQDIGGDGCAMVYLAGGKMTDMEFIQFEPSAAVWPPPLCGKSIITTMFYEGAVLRGNNGERFMLQYGEDAERVSKDLLSKCIYREMLENGTTEHGGVWFDATSVPEHLWNGIYKPYLDRYLAHGIDMRKEPVEIAPAAHTTCGGVLIDADCNTGVPGLLACGEVTGGLHGANRLGGNAGLETMVYGRAAGLSAIPRVLEVVDLSEDSVANRLPDIDIPSMRTQLSQLIRTSLGVIRNEASMEQGICETERLLQMLGSHKNCYEKHRLYNDLITIQLALTSAKNRIGSIGCHYRSDSKTESAKYRIIIQQINGEMHLSKDAV